MGRSAGVPPATYFLSYLSERAGETPALQAVMGRSASVPPATYFLSYLSERAGGTPALQSVMGRLVPALCAAALAIAALAVVAPARAQRTPPAALPPGEGSDLMTTACSQCHPLNVIRSMREGAEGWKRHVYNMVTRGAQLNAREADTVVAYLAANFGPTATPAASAATVTLPGGPGKDLVEARCTACHDLERVAVIKRQKADWPALVANMVGRGAVATPDEVKAITSYLVSHFGGE